MSSELDHRITDNTNLISLHVYILKNNSRYFGYDVVGTSNLREYTLADVETTVKAAFQGNVFVDSTINPNTMCVVVPDNWDNLMPQGADALMGGIEIVPFVYFLHPGISQRELQDARPPADAAVKLEYQKIMNAKSGRVPPGKIRAIVSSPENIAHLLKTYGVLDSRSFQAKAETMEPIRSRSRGSREPSVTRAAAGQSRQASVPRPRASSVTGRGREASMTLPHPEDRRRLSLTRRESVVENSNTKDLSMQRGRRSESLTRKPSWQGQMETMINTPYEKVHEMFGPNDDNSEEYRQAWEGIRQRAAAMP